MDSLDAQCLLIEITQAELRPPDLWRHDRSGELACAYEDGTQTFTWRSEQVAALAQRWRNRKERRLPDLALALRNAHERLAELAEEASLPAADVVIHDLPRAELRGVWEDQKVVLVVERIGEAACPNSGKGGP